jgi:hypothetical protein
MLIERLKLFEEIAEPKACDSSKGNREKEKIGKVEGHLHDSP